MSIKGRMWEEIVEEKETKIQKLGFWTTHIYKVVQI
jgi:hypothetical protein